MAAVSSATAAGATSAQPIVKKDIEVRVKELIAKADKKYKLSDADIDKTFADTEYTKLEGRAKIYICKCNGDPAALIPVLYQNHVGYLVVALHSGQQFPKHYIYQYGQLYILNSLSVDEIFAGTSSTGQIQLEGKS